MIVKTGANYQAEGGYIEASVVGNKIVATINGIKKEYPYFDTSVGESSVVPITISKSENAESTTISCVVYQRYTLENGDFVYDYKNTALTTTEITGYFAPTDSIGLFLTMPAGVIPKLADGSKDCKIVKRSVGDTRFLIITGPEPIAIIDKEE